MDKEQKYIEKKKIITDALKSCLMKNVYSKITVQDIATEAGFSKGGLLHYFHSKEDIYLELIKNLFNDIESDQTNVLTGNLKSNEKAGISALFGVEKFIMDPQNSRILLNLFLYSFEEEKIKEEIKSFLENQHNVYKSIISESETSSSEIKSDHVARFIQVLLIMTGIIETLSPTELDPMSLVKQVVSLIKKN